MTVRISATDWVEGGVTRDDAVEIARAFRDAGAAAIDVSTGQVTPGRAAGRSAGRYQTPYADAIRNQVGIPTIAVGVISSYDDVNSIILAGRADLCALGRVHLYDPSWTLHAAVEQGYDGPGCGVAGAVARRHAASRRRGAPTVPSRGCSWSARGRRGRGTPDGDRWSPPARNDPQEDPLMSVLSDLVAALESGQVEVVDLTARCRAPPRSSSCRRSSARRRGSSSRRSAGTTTAGPAWYWNNFRTGEHTGTHLDAPNHWVTGQRPRRRRPRYRRDRLVAPAAVLDFSAQAAQDPDFLLEVDHIRAWEAEHGALPAGGWLLLRTGWDARSGDAGGVPQRRRDRPAHARDLASAPAGSPRRRRHRASGWRPSAPTPVRRTRSTRRSRATRSCWARQVRPDPAAEPRTGCRPPAPSSSPARCRSSAAPAARARVLALVER